MSEREQDPTARLPSSESPNGGAPSTSGEEGKKLRKEAHNMANRLVIAMFVAGISFLISVRWNLLENKALDLFNLALGSGPDPEIFLGEAEHLEWARGCQKEKLYSPSCLERCAAFANQTVLFGKAEGVLSKTDHSCHSCPYSKPFDTLFVSLELLVKNSNRRWGKMLDAGTGVSSLRWAQQLETADEITAVTVSEQMMGDVRKKVFPKEKEKEKEKEEFFRRVKFVLGDWNNQSLLQGEQFDHILADYLIGAVDGFTPYTQDQMFERLKRHLREGSSRLFVVGMEPYPEKAPSLAGSLVLEVARLRDACILLHRQRPYREYPLEWITRTLENAGYVIHSQQAFPVIYGAKKLVGQLNVCTHKFSGLKDPELSDLQKALKRRVERLKYQIETNEELKTGLCFGMDYVVEAGLPS